MAFPTPNLDATTYTAAETISGLLGVALSSGRIDWVTRADPNSGFRMPAFGINLTDVLSGQQIIVGTQGTFLPDQPSRVTWSGQLWYPLYVGSGGLISLSSGVSGTTVQQAVGMSISGGLKLGYVGYPVGAGASIGSGQIGSGHLASGLIYNLETNAVISSGQVQSGYLGNNAVVSGSVASGQLCQFHIASGAVNSGQINTTGTPGVAAFLRGDLSWASPPVLSGSIKSGYIVSGAVTGQSGGGAFTIASGTISQADIAAGGIASGNYASGSIGPTHISSGCVQSGAINTTGTPSTSVFLRGDFAWSAPTASVGSGGIQSGMIASGAVQGYFGATRHIASGTLGVFDLGSGAIQSGNIASGSIQGQAGSTINVASGTLAHFDFGSGAIQSGDVASGQLGVYHHQSGIQWSGLVQSGGVGSGAVAGAAGGGYRNVSSGTISTNDIGSGAIQSGQVASGQLGVYHLQSGITTSGLYQSGSIGSGQIGTFHFSSGSTVTRAQWTGPFVSGTFASGISEEIISGQCAVCISQSGNLRIAMASVSGRMPAIGVVVDNVASGIQCNVYAAGILQLVVLSGQMTYSGYLGQPVYVGRSGQLVTFSGANNSGGFASGDVLQQIGVVLNSGGLVTEIGSVGLSPSFGSITSGMIASGSLSHPVFGSGAVQSGDIASGQIGISHHQSGLQLSGMIWSGGVGSGSVTGQAGGGLLCIASGTLKHNDFGSGAVQSGDIASGQLGVYHLQSGLQVSGIVNSGGVGSGQLSTYHHASGTMCWFSLYHAMFLSGRFALTAITEETVSGIRLVAISRSGNLRVAKAGTSGRMPAVGLVLNNVASGIQCNVYDAGVVQYGSGTADFSGFLGRTLYVGNSGIPIQISGGYGSGGLISGAGSQVYYQAIGVAVNSGASTFNIAQTGTTTSVPPFLL
jgi:hypothetical protein